MRPRVYPNTLAKLIQSSDFDLNLKIPLRMRWVSGIPPKRGMKSGWIVVGQLLQHPPYDQKSQSMAHSVVKTHMSWASDTIHPLTLI